MEDFKTQEHPFVCTYAYTLAILMTIGIYLIPAIRLTHAVVVNSIRYQDKTRLFMLVVALLPLLNLSIIDDIYYDRHDSDDVEANDKIKNFGLKVFENSVYFLPVAMLGLLYWI